MKETREQYAARRARIDARRRLHREVHATLKGSQRLGKHEPTWDILRRRDNCAAEGDFRTASLLHELMKLRRVLLRKDRLIAELRDSTLGGLVAAAARHAEKRGFKRGLADGALSPVAVKERRLARRAARAASKAKKRGVLAALAMVLLSALPALAAPTIVVIVADDMREQDVQVVPSLQQIAADGTAFDASISTFPLCTPSRMTLLTGWHQQRHGVYVNDAGLTDPAWPTLATRLHDAGWRTAMVGKYANKMRNLARRPDGWDRWFALDKHSDYGREQTQVLANRASDFLRECKADGVPCFVYVAPAAPHGPNFGPSPECDSAPSLPLPEGGDAQRWRQRMSSLCGLNLLVSKVRRVAPADAWVLALSDQGYMMENGRAGKNETVWDALRTTLRIAGPGIPVGMHRREVVTLADVHATVLDLAGVQVQDGDIDGQSLLPMLHAPADAPPVWQPFVLIEAGATSAGEE